MGIRVGERPTAARWFVPPRLRTLADEGERHASWLELFFDLVFVVAITELSHELVLDHSAGGFLRFAALFIPVYVAWQGYMAYATRFDTDDLAFRAGYFAAMLAIAAMAVVIVRVRHFLEVRRVGRRPDLRAEPSAAVDEVASPHSDKPATPVGALGALHADRPR